MIHKHTKKVNEDGHPRAALPLEKRGIKRSDDSTSSWETDCSSCRGALKQIPNDKSHFSSSKKPSLEVKSNGMIIVHDIFVAKPGNASKLAKLFKEAMADQKNVSIMTDVTGQFNRVIMASWYESIEGWNKEMESYRNPTPEMQAAMEKMKGYTDLYLTGSREIYRTW